jgi:hypothetical protein
MILDMCRTMMERPDETDAWLAGKVMENVISWGAGGKVDEVVPGFVGLAVTRLLDEGELKVQGDQLLVMCVNVVLSALRYNASILVMSMESATSAEGEFLSPRPAPPTSSHP